MDPPTDDGGCEPRGGGSGVHKRLVTEKNWVKVSFRNRSEGVTGKKYFTNESIYHSETFYHKYFCVFYMSHCYVFRNRRVVRQTLCPVM